MQELHVLLYLIPIYIVTFIRLQTCIVIIKFSVYQILRGQCIFQTETTTMYTVFQNSVTYICIIATYDVIQFIENNRLHIKVDA